MFIDTLKQFWSFHIHNSFDKTLLDNPNQFVKESKYEVSDFVKEQEILNFSWKILILFEKYEPGNPLNKKDVTIYMNLVKKTRRNN